VLIVADLARMLNHHRVEIDWITVSSFSCRLWPGFVKSRYGAAEVMV